jgi:DNA-binding NtrC family response regulator
MVSPSQPLTLLGMPVVVASGVMRELFQVVERVAATTATVLIGGESGSGKELVARAVHHYSLRCHKPWVDVSCAALPEHLMESELFGYERGAFSGADTAKPGLFELAHGGTLFLDEIGELDPRMQVKLLRVLDGVPYYRLGGTRKVVVDVRIVAATNRNLEEAVAEGRFRGDLYHRLSQISLWVPPLRDRRDDIVPIARHFLAQQNPRLEFSADALAALEAHDWRGNIRELKNRVIKAAVLARGTVITAAQLHLDVNPAVRPAPGERNGHHPGSLDPMSLEDVERQTILSALEKTGGHQQKAAALLGISRRTLSRKLKLWGVEAENLIRAC